MEHIPANPKDAVQAVQAVTRANATVTVVYLVILGLRINAEVMKRKMW
jgi:hypothetical protein